VHGIVWPWSPFGPMPWLNSLTQTVYCKPGPEGERTKIIVNKETKTNASEGEAVTGMTRLLPLQATLTWFGSSGLTWLNTITDANQQGPAGGAAVKLILILIRPMLKD
jgi:hypothetical protein